MASRKALIVGGTGPSGPCVVRGLLERGFETTVFHTGRHEVADDAALASALHLHGNPYDADSIAATLGAQTFDVVVAAYGRTRLLARHLAGRCARLVAISGLPVYRGMIDRRQMRPTGLRIPAAETHPLVDGERDPPGSYPSIAIRQTEEEILALHRERAFEATVVRLPWIYGPRDVLAREWSVVRRILDRRPWILVADDGLAIHARCAARNAAALVLLALDRSEVASGQIYHCADEQQQSVRQWVEAIAECMGASLELRSIPGEIPSPGRQLAVSGGGLCPHSILDTTKARTQLGYRDAISAEDALRECVAWYVKNAAAMAGRSGLADAFDYAAEDRLLAAWEQAKSKLLAAAAPFAGIGRQRNPQTAKAHGAS